MRLGGDTGTAAKEVSVNQETSQAQPSAPRQPKKVLARSFFSAHQKARGVLRPSERGDYVTPFIVCYETALRVLQPRVEPADRDMVCAAVAGFLCRV